MNDTATPRTDASKAKAIKNGFSPIIYYCYENDIAKLERELTTVTEQRDRLATILQNIRSGYGGQIPDPTCDCGDCEFLITIDNALQYITKSN